MYLFNLLLFYIAMFKSLIYYYLDIDIVCADRMAQ